jgi:hypothetical protein
MAGTVTRISYEFQDRQTGGGDWGWYIDRGPASGNLAGGVLPDGGGTGPLIYSTGFSVAAGDHLNFVVDPNTYDGGGNGSDLIRLVARIEFTPTPGAEYFRLRLVP